MVQSRVTEDAVMRMINNELVDNYIKRIDLGEYLILDLISKVKSNDIDREVVYNIVRLRPEIMKGMRHD